MHETTLACLEMRLLRQRILHRAKLEPLAAVREKGRRRHRDDPVPAAPHGDGVR
ncbi:hypothetical protein CSAL01_13778, partial [Colletotrichum salicis]